MLTPDARPSIPQAEYPRRWAQELMRARGLDLLLAYSDDRAVFGPARVPVDEVVRHWQQPSSAQRTALRAYMGRRKHYLRYA